MIKMFLNQKNNPPIFTVLLENTIIYLNIVMNLVDNCLNLAGYKN